MYLRRTRFDDLEGVIGIEECEDTAQWFTKIGRAWHEAALDDPDQVHLLFCKSHHDTATRQDVEELVGFAVVAGTSKPGPIELRRMVISPMQRGKGYGRQLLGELLKHIAEDLPDRDVVWLEVRSDHATAQQLYESVGFEPGDPPQGVEAQPGMRYLVCEL